MLEIRVLTGLYKGAVFPLLDETLVIGSSDDCDLTLFDTDVHPFHVILSFNGTECFLENNEEEVFGLANERLTAGQLIQPKSPFRIGTVWLVYTDSNDEWLNQDTVVEERAEKDDSSPPLDRSKDTLQPKTGMPTWWRVGAAIVVSLPIMMFFLVILAPENPGPSMLELNPPAPTLDVGESLTKFINMLEDRGLSLAVETKVIDEDKIRVNGKLTASQYGILNRMIRRFQQDYVSLVSVVNNTQLLSPTLPFDVVTIVGGTHSHVMTDCGDIIFVGEEKDGYKLSEIRHDTVYFVGPSEVELQW